MSRKKRGALVEELGREMRAFQAAVDALDEAAAAHLGVNRTDLRCLDVLLQLGAATPGQLGARLGLTTGSVTAMLDRLQEQGYLTRSHDPADRRKVVVRPSPEAARPARELYGPIAQAGGRLASRYSILELELLVGFLRRSRELQEHHVGRIRSLGRAP